MKQYSVLIFLLIYTCKSGSAAVDSSTLIFDSSKVYSYQLHFYVTDFEQQLKKNYDSGQVYMPARFTYGTMVLDSVGVRYKGNSSYVLSQNTRKKPLKISFDEYKDQTFFGIKTLNFSNCVKDPSFMRERIAYDIARRYMPAPRTAYTNIFFESDLIGLYVQVEQIDKTFLKRHFDDNDFNLYKAGDDGQASLEYLGATSSCYDSVYELKTNETLNDWSAFITMIDKLNYTPVGVFADTIKNYLNLDRAMGLLAFNMVFSHFDSYTGSGRNFYLYDDSISGQFHILIWDLNESFGAYTNNWNVITVDVTTPSNLAKRPLNKRILENDSLKQAYLRKINAMIHGHCVYDTIAALSDRVKPVIQSHVLADKCKLYTDQNFHDNVESDVYMGPQGTIPGIKSFSKKRNVELQKQLDKYMIIPIISDLNTPSKPGIMLRNFPNPFKTQTTILFNNPHKNAQVRILSINGRVVFSETTKRDFLKWNAPDAPAGAYIVEVKTGGRIFSKYITLVK